MEIGGLQKVSLIEYPRRICAVIFTRGCNFRCPYCHNPELVDPSLYAPLLPEREVFSFLEKRQGKIDAVSITGGEPTVQTDLLETVRRIKDIGYLVKVDTNGSRPDVLERLMTEGLTDYIAMDIKGPLQKYSSLAKVPVLADNIRRSIEIIMAAGIDYEFRTTVVKQMLTEEDLNSVGSLIGGARLYVLQAFNATKLLDETLPVGSAFTSEELDTLRTDLEKKVNRVMVR